MRIVTIKSRIEYEGVTLRPGLSYVMSEQHEEALTAQKVVDGSIPIDTRYKKYSGEDLNGKTLLTWRTGGVGDIFMLHPALKAIKKKYPECKIVFGTMCPWPVMNSPYIDRLIKMPFSADELEAADYHVMYEGLVESGKGDAATLHATDIYSRELCTGEYEDKKPDSYTSRSELESVAEEMKKLGVTPEDIVIGIQVEPSSPVRRFPLDKLIYVAHSLIYDGFKVMVVGANDSGVNYKNVLNNARPDQILDGTRYTARESIVLASRYDLIIAPDSMMIQVGAAHDVPVVGLYGPFPSSIRMKYHKNSIGLDPKTVCTPCCIHDFKPCVKGFPSPCYSQVSPRDILEAVDYLLYPKIKRHLKCLQPV